MITGKWAEKQNANSAGKAILRVFTTSPESGNTDTSCVSPDGGRACKLEALFYETKTGNQCAHRCAKRK